jgi:hypothetical protein
MIKKKQLTTQTFPLDEETKKKIIEYLGIEKVEQEKQDEMIAKIGEVAFKQLFLETMDRLDEKKQEEFAKLLEREASSEEVNTFLLEAIPDYTEMTKKVIADLMENLKQAGEKS